MKYRKSNTGTQKGEHPDGGGLAIFPRSVCTTIPELFEGRRQIHLTGPVLLSVTTPGGPAAQLLLLFLVQPWDALTVFAHRTRRL